MADPQSELLPVVDEADNLLALCPRHIVHAVGLRHRAVHILVFDNAGQVFLQKRSRNKDLHPGLWDTSAAGHVDASEDYETSARRELREELGVEESVGLTSLFKISPTVENGNEFVQVYQLIHNGPFLLSTDEIETGTWWSTLAVDALVNSDNSLLTPNFKQLWRQWRSICA